MITENIIGFQVSASSGKKVFAYDPRAMSQLPEVFTVASTAETNLAVEKAHLAWRIYRNISKEKKANFLNHIAEGIEALGNQLVRRIMQETAYPESRIITERNRTCAQLRMFANIVMEGAWRDVTVDQAIPDRTPIPRPDLRKMMYPIGPVIVFGASNFPLAYSTAGGDVASALAAGCPVIVKAHDSHLGTNALVAEVILNAAKATGMPDGVFSSLIGDSFETAKQLVLHPLTAAVGFTGSLQGGRALFDLGQQRPKPIPVFAEMGSVNPIFILPGAMEEEKTSLANQLTNSMTMTLGQFCTKPGILVALDNANTTALLQEIRINLEKVAAGPLLNAGISKSFQQGVERIKSEARINLIFESNATEQDAGPFFASVPADVFLSHPALAHEIFGPFTLLVLCQGTDQMKQVASSLEGQLTSSIHGNDRDLDVAHELLEILIEKAGRIIFNGVPTGVEVSEGMTHGGPYPASTDNRFTAVGHHAIRRWIRPVTFQNLPEKLLPGEVL